MIKRTALIVALEAVASAVLLGFALWLIPEPAGTLPQRIDGASVIGHLRFSFFVVFYFNVVLLYALVSSLGLIFSRSMDSPMRIGLRVSLFLIYVLLVASVFSLASGLILKAVFAGIFVLVSREFIAATAN